MSKTHFRQSSSIYKSLCGNTSYMNYEDITKITCKKCIELHKNHKPIPKQVETTEIEHAKNLHSDAGDGHTFKCPKCDDEITIADYGWWENRCSCGYRWSLELKAVGELD